MKLYSFIQARINQCCLNGKNSIVIVHLQERDSLMGTHWKAVMRKQKVFFLVSGRTCVLQLRPQTTYEFIWFNSKSHEGMMVPHGDSQSNGNIESGVQTRKSFTAKAKQGNFSASVALLLLAIGNLSPCNVLGFDGLGGQDAAFYQRACLLQPSGNDILEDTEAQETTSPCPGSKWEQRSWRMETADPWRGQSACG